MSRDQLIEKMAKRRTVGGGSSNPRPHRAGSGFTTVEHNLSDISVPNDSIGPSAQYAAIKSKVTGRIPTRGRKP